MNKFETTGEILGVEKNLVKIKIANDDTFVIGFPVHEEERQMYLDRVGQQVTVTCDQSVDEVKNKLLLNWTFSMSAR